MSHRKYLTTAAVVAAVAAAPAVALASPANSIQPGRTFFGHVMSGDHPNRLVTLHNGTGAPRRIAAIGVAGGGGYKFTLPANTPLLAKSGLERCSVGVRLAAGARCALDVRVHTTRPGWWRAVLSVTYGNGWNNSGELEAHVVAAMAARSAQPGSCGSVSTAMQSCGS